jgi:diguanylate cyclase (GGDEF)-like protein
MRHGLLTSPTATAALIAIAGAGLVLPLLPGVWQQGAAGTIVDMAGRCIAFLALVLLATRHPAREPHEPVAMTGGKPPGRAEFHDALRQELLRLQRFSRPFALVSIHCDGATALREQDGGRVAAALMRCAADTISANLRRTDFSAAVDAESFGVLLPETDASTAGIVVDQLRERLRQAMRERQWPASFSIGVSVFTLPVDALETALARGDELMARVRRRGRNGLLIETDGVRQRDAQPEHA